MTIRTRYALWRYRLGIVSGFVFIIAYFLGFASSPSSLTQEQKATFVWNLGMLLTIVWIYSSGLARLGMITGYKVKWFSIIALLCVIAAEIIAPSLFPGKRELTSVVDVIYAIFVRLWLYGWTVLDIAELVL